MAADVEFGNNWDVISPGCDDGRPSPHHSYQVNDLLSKLCRRLDDVISLNSKLILLVGPSRSGKTQLLRQLGAKFNLEPLNVGLELGRRLAAMPNTDRGFSAGELLREIADKERTGAPLLLDNLELLFEPSLQINPLDLVKRVAHSKRVVAVWPGELHGDRLVYADMSHPEYRDFSREGVVVIEIMRMGSCCF